MLKVSEEYEGSDDYNMEKVMDTQPMELSDFTRPFIVS